MIGRGIMALAILAGAFPTLAAAQGSTNILQQQATEIRQLNQTAGVAWGAQSNGDVYPPPWMTRADERLLARRILAAGRWGRCVVDAAPENSAAYVGAEPMSAKLAADQLRPVFRHCRGAASYWVTDLSVPVRQAAIRDALAVSARRVTSPPID